MEVDVEYQTQLIPSEIYSIDTSVILDIWCPPEGNMFSKHKLPELWNHIEKLVQQGKIIASKEVLDELERHASDDLLTWLKDHKEIFIFDREQLEAAEGLINTFYSKYKRGYKPEIGNAADPFVIAAAITKSAVVFTSEHEQGDHDPKDVNEPTIPTICKNYGIECVNIEQFIEREGFRISLK